METYGVERWLGELAQTLKEETYRPEAIRRVSIPKANGKPRALGIATLRDRVCMSAARLVLEPIFEADLPPEQSAYRPGRSALDAVREVEGLLKSGYGAVVDADLSDYFGSIPHAELLKSVARRVVDRRVLHLIKQWLECPVEETDRRGRTRRTSAAKDQRRGLAQGSPLSPLLANLYMRRFVLGWKKRGLECRLGSRLVTYADDLVILCRPDKADEALGQLREIMGTLKLTVNEAKTRVCQLPEGEFDFLGYRFGRLYSPRTGRPYVGAKPSRRSVKGVIEKIHTVTVRSGTGQDTTEGNRSDPSPPLGALTTVDQWLTLKQPLISWGGLNGYYRGGQATEPNVARLSQLFSVGLGQQGVSGGGRLHHDAVAPVVAQETQGAQKRVTRLSPRVSLPDVGSGLLADAKAQRAVGEGVRSCPRARCWKSARRVR